ncbi:lytic transglycosylase domain-containing protein [Paramagnetospirillum magneticum]|uniref:Soluble lytic murein transglycosylase and related regulatory protein n=1 Tax=Paramagnetospirillum magneticum (strain ATCC 700264 / AMB-1) TaxID=342108 RepID=Q2VYX3_PARM1|nr:lytic transglycosylase domain-containing protein [Paramagnetospirillum magneticum]BAE53202.1 Soluble lytic murein transglycosylase and related regulatory protein [Paramagnetospirillum magneticum AMB-1]
MRDRLLPAVMLAIMAATSPALAGEPVKPAKVRIAAADGAQTAAILPGSNREARVAPLPKPLSAGDVDLYKRVMALQTSGQFAAADRELGKIRDELLKGHVLAQRLMAPGAKPKFQEIRAWLADYADLPQAEAIHKLAKGLKGVKGGGALRAPAKGGLKGTGISSEDDGATWEEVAYDVDSSSAKVKAFKAKLRQSLRDEEPARVEAMMASAEAQSLSELDFDRMRLMVAADHFAGGRDEPAATLAGLSAERSGEQLPAAHWIAGLAQWRMGKPDVARRHFEEVAKYSDGQDWLSAAGAFWAARANLVTRRPEAVNHWLELAATSSRTYYGLLARAELGHGSEFSWEVPPFTEGDADLLMRVSGARRALGLLQLGDRAAAEEELRKLYPNASKGLRQSMLVMAYAGQMPALAVSLGGSLPRENGRLHDAAAFPVPDWTPKGGWQIDKALVFALVRQESSFNPSARSGVGAAGLMQLMPATAAAIGGRGAGARLSDPEHNLGLGQRYVAKLLEEEPVNGNLLLMAAAYNAGPGNLGRWLTNIRHNDDPLLLVESLPARQTRVFVQRVMTGYWIYQSRLGQKSDTLDAVASGDWPFYNGQDPVHPRIQKVSR